MTNTTTPRLPLAEQVKSVMAEPLVTEKDVLQWSNEYNIWKHTEIDWVVYLEQKINEKAEAREQQVLSMIDKTAKELEAKRLEAEQALPKCYPYDRQDAATFGEMNAYGHALALLIDSSQKKEEGVVSASGN